MNRNIQTPANGYDMLKFKEKTTKKRYYIGIDVGVNTGVAVWDSLKRELLSLETVTIHKAFDRVQACIACFGKENIHVRFEDARLRKWFGNAGREQLQGAGSVKRDSKIWEDYLTDLFISFEAVAPKNNTTKLKADNFNRITGWKSRTTEHSRDAAFLVFGC